MPSPLGDPDAIDRLATTVSQRAENLSALAHQLRFRASGLSWTAPRADRFRQDMSARADKAGTIAVQLRDISLELRKIAARLRAQLEALQRFERSVRDFINRFVPQPGQIPPWQRLGLDPRRLPASGDPVWEQLAKTLRLG